MPPVINSLSRQAGVLADFQEMWRQAQPKFEKICGIFGYKIPFKNLRESTYVFKESLPMVSPWPYGKGRVVKGLQDRQFKLAIANYELTIGWNGFDEDDDQLGDLRTHVEGAVNRYGMLPILLYTEYLNGVAVYNESLKNAFDGATLFSATDGDGADRLGVSGGNIVSGTSTTVAGILHDFAVAQQRFMSMLDPTAGLPLFDEMDAAYSKMTAIIPKNLNEIFQKAANAENIRIDLTNNTSESNYLKGTFQYMVNPYLADTSDWYIVLNHPYYKPFIYSEDSIENFPADPSNSDRAREYNEYALYTHIRNRVGPLFPGSIIKVNI